MGEWKGIESFNNDPSLHSESTVLNREGLLQNEIENMKTSEHNSGKI